jgi:hypothetical protein
MPRRPTHVVLSFTTQDGYTLERVDVYGLVDGVHETVVIPGAECYVGRSDNPSFSSCGLLFSIPFSWASTKAFRIPPKKKTFSTPSWLGAARRAYEYHLACRRPVGPEQGTVT